MCVGLAHNRSALPPPLGPSPGPLLPSPAYPPRGGHREAAPRQPRGGGGIAYLALDPSSTLTRPFLACPPPLRFSSLPLHLHSPPPPSQRTSPSLSSIANRRPRHPCRRADSDTTRHLQPVSPDHGPVGACIAPRHDRGLYRHHATRLSPPLSLPRTRRTPPVPRLVAQRSLASRRRPCPHSQLDPPAVATPPYSPPIARPGAHPVFPGPLPSRALSRTTRVSPSPRRPLNRGPAFPPRPNTLNRGRLNRGQTEQRAD